MKLTLPISAAFHLVLIALLFLFSAAVKMPPTKIDLSNAVDVVFTPAPLRSAPPPPPAPPQPAAEVETPPPPKPEPAAQPPQPPAPVAETPPPPPPKPEPKPAAKPRPVHQAQPQPMPQLALPLPLPNQSTAPQTAALPPPAPAPTVSADYRTLLSGWLESHKRYPEDARQRGEEGRAVLRFRVDHYGRVIDYAVVSSTGFADLDRAVENMMRGATMPPFPPSMPQPEIEVSVTIRFGLSR